MVEYTFMKKADLYTKGFLPSIDDDWSSLPYGLGLPFAPPEVLGEISKPLEDFSKKLKATHLGAGVTLPLDVASLALLSTAVGYELLFSHPLKKIAKRCFR